MRRNRPWFPMPGRCGEAANERAEQASDDERSAEELIREGGLKTYREPGPGIFGPHAANAPSPNVSGRQSEQDQDADPRCGTVRRNR